MWVVKAGDKDHLEYLSIDGRMNITMQTGFIWLRIVGTDVLL